MVTWAASPYCWGLCAWPHVDRDISASGGWEGRGRKWYWSQTSSV